MTFDEVVNGKDIQTKNNLAEKEKGNYL